MQNSGATKLFPNKALEAGKWHFYNSVVWQSAFCKKAFKGLQSNNDFDHGQKLLLNGRKPENNTLQRGNYNKP